MYENGEIDENQYKDVADELRQKKLLKTGGITIGAITEPGGTFNRRHCWYRHFACNCNSCSGWRRGWRNGYLVCKLVFWCK